MAGTTQHSSYTPYTGKKDAVNKNPIRVLHLTQPDEAFSKKLFG
jgi:hypothetical protein